MANLLALVSFKVFPPQMGGQKGVTHFYQYLAKHHTIFIAGSKDNEYEGEEFIFFPDLYSNKMMLLNFFSIKKLQKIIREHNIQCVIAEHSYTGWLGFLLKKKMKIPFIIHSHNLESHRFKQMGKWWWKMYWKYEKYIHQKADHNFFISEDDMTKAMKEFQLKEKKCSVITYGVDEIVIRKNARDQLKKILGIGDEAIFLFNGTLNYKPNKDAVNFLLYKLDPVLQKENLLYKIVITGSQASASLQKQIAANHRFIYQGFVDDAALYYQGADLFINPVDNDSGIKTKMVEALANNCTVITAKAGATGIPGSLAGEKFVIVNDWDAGQMTKQILLNIDQKYPPVSPAFLSYFNWNNIAAKASQQINHLLFING